MTKIKISAPNKDFTIMAEAGQSLASAVWLSGQVAPLPLCSGLGCCGLCRVRFISEAPAPLPAEEAKLGAEKTGQGWRLACRHFCGKADEQNEITIALPEAAAPAAKPHFSIFEQNVHPPLLLAVDLGTTSIHYAALEAASGRIVAQGRELNPQFGAGAEVMSRLAMAATPKGQKRLADAVISLLQNISAALPAPVQEICLAGNSAMTAILLGKDVSGLSFAPYHLDYNGGQTENIPGLAPVFIPPLISPFVGADISAGMADLLNSFKPTYPFLLADLGTNGEFVLAAGPQKNYVASVPLGPALEGIGLVHGKMAGRGVAYGFALEPGGLKALGDGPATAICGVGYLSLLHILLRVGLLNAEGRFCHSSHDQAHPQHPLGARLAKGIRKINGETALDLPGGLALYARDVEEILKVKAAFAMAVDSLLAAAKIKAGDLKHIFLAGALGEHVVADDLEALGFVPHGLGRRIERVGNSSLAGAALLLTDRAWRQKMEDWRKSCILVDLTAVANFDSIFTAKMSFNNFR